MTFIIGGVLQSHDRLPILAKMRAFSPKQPFGFTLTEVARARGELTILSPFFAFFLG